MTDRAVIETRSLTKRYENVDVRRAETLSAVIFEYRL
jgi:hypothetical protein